MEFSITHIDTACVILEIKGYRILTDPTLDNAGKLYYHGYGSFSRKTDSPALTPADLGEIDLILLSHHQHKDNFDDRGKEFASTVSKIISTKAAQKVLSNVTGLDDWESIKIDTPKVTNLKITAVPAQHHPWWIPEFISGKVTGFIIEFDGQENGVLYISGDTVFFNGINEISKKYKIDTAVFNLGSVQFRYLTGFGQYTMGSSGLIKAVEILQPRKVIPVHHRGWTHFKENETELRNAIAGNSNVSSRILFLTPGMKTDIN